ncbi:MAG: hypothetical protein ABFD07_19285 [Methanobacterium sp.]
MKTCTNCILTEYYPNISFNEVGICNYCINHQKITYAGEEKLIRILEKYRKNDGNYDCIVTLSGGRDSSYTLLKLVKDYKMNVLAVNYQNPFTHPQAEINIKNAVKLLDVDLIKFSLKDDLHKKTMESSLNSWLKKPSASMIPIICMACKTIWYDIIKIAKNNHINCIVSGGSPIEDSSFKMKLLNLSENEDPKSHFTKSIFTITSEVLRNINYLNPVNFKTMIKGFLFGNPYALGSKIYGRSISKIDLFYYTEWKEEEVLSRIRSELNWSQPKDSKSTWRFDCKIGHLKDFMYAKTVRVSEKQDFYSKLIREGAITREIALKKLKEEIHSDDNQLNSILEELNIEDDSFFENFNQSIL